MLTSTLRHAWIAVAVLVVGVAGSAALVPIGGAVIAPGTVAAESHNKRIAHPSGGAVAEIYVRNGDKVAVGAPLIRLDATVATAEAALAASTHDQLMAQKARLEAERSGAPALAFPDELSGRTDEGAAAIMGNERKLFAMRLAEEQGSLAQFAARIGQLEQQIAGYRAQIAASRRQMALIAPERAGIASLYERGYVTLARRNELERRTLDYQGGVASLQTMIAQAQEKIIETREQMRQLRRARQAEAATQLASVESALAQQRARSVATDHVKQDAVIKAPYAGVVEKLSVASIGDVVRAAEPILELVPTHGRFVIDAVVGVGDVDRVTTGQSARVRFPALNGATTPDVDGRVLSVASDRSVDPRTGAAFFAVRVSFDGPALRQSVALKSGMPAEVFIQTGSRSMTSYIIKPLREQLQRAFRDDNR